MKGRALVPMAFAPMVKTGLKGAWAPFSIFLSILTKVIACFQERQNSNTFALIDLQKGDVLYNILLYFNHPELTSDCSKVFDVFLTAGGCKGPYR